MESDVFQGCPGSRLCSLPVGKTLRSAPSSNWKSALKTCAKSKDPLARRPGIRGVVKDGNFFDLETRVP